MSATFAVADASVDACLRRGAAQLQAASDSPRLDAELLLAMTLGLSRMQLRIRGEQVLGAAQLRAYAGAIERRRQGEPVAYILGAKEFWSLPLRVTSAVLVPRPETELLVEWSLQCLQEISAPMLADLGTGSGAIALALAHERADAGVVAVDASAAALEVARENARQLNLVGIDFRCGDWFKPLAGERFDLLVSNPPYIADGDAHLQALQHEPLAALTSGAEGLDAIRHLVQHAPAHLQPGGWLLLEHGSAQAALARALLQARGFEAVATRCDLAGLERASGGRWARRGRP